jgi:rsbT co-antagonist protein RsbR
MWSKLRLQYRILLSYGVILALSVALITFLIARTVTLTNRINQISQAIRAEASASVQLSIQISAVQNSVDRYLLTPNKQSSEQANQALEALIESITAERSNLALLTEQQDLNAFGNDIAAYKASFQALNNLILDQVDARNVLDKQLLLASEALNDIFARYVEDDRPDPITTNTLVDAQNDMGAAIFFSTELITDQNPDFGSQAIQKLASAKRRLYAVDSEVGRVTASFIVSATNSLDQTITPLLRYSSTINQIKKQRTLLLDDQGRQLEQQAQAILQNGLQRMSATVADLEDQASAARQFTLVALLLTLAIAFAGGIWLAQTITRPLQKLVVGTTELAQGNYDVTVDQRDGSEIGQLAVAFNQMTSTLKAQQTEVARQQTALAERNQALEQSLHEVQAANTARDAMAATIRQLSVPVIPILSNVLLVPLVGEIDEARAQVFMQRLLDSVVKQRARLAILDVSGVPVVDQAVARWLLDAVEAARLIGAESVLVGIGPEMAEALVAIDIDLSRFSVQANLMSAVEYAVRSTTARQKLIRPW